MVEQFKEIADILEKQGHKEGAFRTRRFAEYNYSLGFIPDTIGNLTNPANVEEREEIREETGVEKIFSYSNFTFYPERNILIRNGIEIHLPKKQSQILQLHASHPNRTLSNEKILKSVWGSEDTAETLLRWQMSNLGRRLKSASPKDKEVRLVNIRGLGYRLVVPELLENQLPPKNNMSKPELPTEKIFNFADFTFFPERCLVQINGRDVNLTSQENKAFLTMANNVNRVTLFSTFEHELYGGQNEHITDIKTILGGIVYRIRKKLDPESKERVSDKYVKSFQGSGYMLVDPEKNRTKEG